MQMVDLFRNPKSQFSRNMKGNTVLMVIWLILSPEVVLPNEIDYSDPLYTGRDVEGFLKLCTGNVTVVEDDDGNDACEPECIPKCGLKRLTRLRDVQEGTIAMLKHMNNFHHFFWQLVVFLVILLLGIYLIWQKHFKIGNIPYIGNPFEDDPTDGYRYSHFMWMQWVTLDSDNPTYYKCITPDIQELEYIPQSETWEDPGVGGSDEDLHPAWSMRDIYDMTADPHERLEFYFRRILLKYSFNNKQGTGKTFKKYKTKKAR